MYEDLVDVASYSYDPVKRELVSYDVPDTVRIKAEYVRAKALAGCMFWEVRRLSGGARVCCCALRVAHGSSRFFLRVRGAAVVERQDGDHVAGVYGGGDARSAGPDAGASGTPVASRVGTAHLTRATRLLQNHLQ